MEDGRSMIKVEDTRYWEDTIEVQIFAERYYKADVSRKNTDMENLV